MEGLGDLKTKEDYLNFFQKQQEMIQEQAKQISALTDSFNEFTSGNGNKKDDEDGEGEGNNDPEDEDLNTDFLESLIQE